MSTRPVEGSEQAANEVVLPHLVPVAASRAGVGAARASKGHAVKLLHYAVAMALAASATALNFTLAHALRGPTLLLPVTAAALAALYGGVGPGLFAAALSVAGHDYFLIEPRYALLIAHRGDAYRLALLAGVASLVAAVSGSLRRAVWRAQEERARAEESAESLAVIEVENQGPTIPTERLAVLFEPFQQGKGDQPGHLGLGLFIVREIVSAHGGTLVATSTLAGVTTLRVELPRQTTGRV